MIRSIFSPRHVGGPTIILFQCAFLLIILAGCTSALAQTTREFRLSDLPQAVQSNPGWRAARHRIEEARGRLIQSGRLRNPEFAIEGRHDTAFNEGGFSVALAQAFPLTARLELEKVVSTKEISIAEAEIRDGLRRLILEAQTHATNYLATRQQIVLQMQRKSIAEELTSFIASAVAVGEIPQLDEKQARLEASRARLQIRKLEAAATLTLGQLRALLGMEPDDPITLLGKLHEPSATTNDIGPDAVTNRPDYQAARLAADRAEKEIELEQAKRREDLTVGVFIEGERTEDAPEGLENEAFTGFRISIPLPFWNKNEGAVHEKKAKATRLREEAAALAVKIRNSAATARAEMETNRALFAELTDQLLPLARQQVSDLESIYRSGQGNIQAVLRAREQSIELESALLDALRDYHLARIRFAAESSTSSNPVPLSNQTP